MSSDSDSDNDNDDSSSEEFNNKKSSNNTIKNDDFEFFNPEKELDMNYDNQIHIHKHQRGTRKCDTIIQGLIFSNKSEGKEFISKIKKKLGIGGCQKMMEVIDKDNMVFVFTGDYRNKIKKILIEDYNKDEDFIKYHG